MIEGLIPDYRLVEWNSYRWPNFSTKEFACPHCGEFWFDDDYFDGIQCVRDTLKKPVFINSAHRCWFHNQLVGGAINSEHKKIALDISLRNLDPLSLYQACLKAGFSSFGFYGTFLHTDRRPGRRWSTAAGRKTWNGLGIF